MMPRFSTRLQIGLVALVTLALPTVAQVQRTGALSVAGVSEELKHAVEDKGYRVVLDDGWTAEFWFARELKTATKDAAGALYPELTNSEFVGVVRLPAGMLDFRGQAIPAGTYTLRYQLIPQDANHMGVSANPDFLLAIPIASDPNPERRYLYKKLVTLSASAAGGAHPAVIALDSSGDPGSVAETGNNRVFSVAVPAQAGTNEKLGIVVRGSAAQ